MKARIIVIIGRREHSLYLDRLWPRCAAANRVTLRQFEYIKLLSLSRLRENRCCRSLPSCKMYAKSEIESDRYSCFCWISKIQIVATTSLSLFLSPSSDFPLESIEIISIIFYEFVIATVCRYFSRYKNGYPIERVFPPRHT